MKWILGMLALTCIFMSLQTLRAEESIEAPRQESQSFSKIICQSSKEETKADLVHGYFLDVDTVQEAQRRYPERFDFLAKRCEGDTHWVVESISMTGRSPRAWNLPCTENAQCESGSCHPFLSKCNPRFPVPFTAAH